MADLAAAYGRGDALGWNLPGAEPRSVGPTPADALDDGPFRVAGTTAGRRWCIYPGHWQTSPPLALAQNPHTIADTASGRMDPISDPSSLTPYIRRRFPIYEAGRTYAKDECVVVRDLGLWPYRSLRDGNTAHHPYTPGHPLGSSHALPYDSTSPDWWQALGHYGGAGMVLSNPTNWNQPPPGVVNWPGYTASPRNVWSGRPVEAATQVGANQWASGECQADWIGPGVRLDLDARDGYATYTEYVHALDGAWINESTGLPEYPATAPGLTEQPCFLRLARIKGDVVTVLQSWTIDAHWTPGSDGPWSVKLAVTDDAQGRPVLSVWTRFWGYDPFERDLDLYPWKYQGSYTDTSAQALRLGQPGFMVWGKPTYAEFVDGETWWGWGEMGGATAPRGSYSPDAESKPGSPTIGADAAFSAPSASLVATAAAFVVRAGTPTLSQTVAQTLTASAGALALTPGMPWLAQARMLSASPASLSLSPGLPFLSQHALSLFKAPDGTALPFRVWSGSQWVEVPVRLWNGSQFN